MNEHKTIANVVKQGLCTWCGTCAAVCPQSAIEMVLDESIGSFIPSLQEDKCNWCEICDETCPGWAVDFTKLNREVFESGTPDAVLGNYLDCYTGYATDSNLRFQSSSGGLVTALLIFALEQGMIEGALVTRMSSRNPLLTEPFIARSREEIISASGSKYCPVPANIAIREILASTGKYAVVGLPCHLHALRKVEQVIPELRERIRFRLGIFCGLTPSFRGTEFLLYKKGILKEQVARLDYRGNGWPGGVTFTLKDGQKCFIPHKDAWLAFGNFFCLTRCSLCYDGVAEFADISFGDAWLPEFASDKSGTSIMVARNKTGVELLQDAVSKGKITLSLTNADMVKKSQRGFAFKKQSLGARISLLRFLRHAVPDYNVPQKASFKELHKAVFFYFENWLASRRYRWKLLQGYIVLRNQASKILQNFRRK